MAEAILPSGPEASGRCWSADHLRLHRSLLQQPSLLPQGGLLLLAVSGGQDSMAMTGLLRDLAPLHRWRLHLWHGDHGWRPESAQQALELAAWAEAQRLPLRVERWSEPEEAGGNREAAARRWRYDRLWREALRLGCCHVLTAHTGSDRAETVLLHLARGSHRRGLASLRRQQPLAALLAADSPGRSSGSAASGGLSPPAEVVVQQRQRRPSGESSGSRAAEPTGVAASDAAQLAPALAASAETCAAAPLAVTSETGLPATAVPEPLLVRPLQIFSRQDTARLCRSQGWPVWLDPLNEDPSLSRNRIRTAVLPVLEALHPGAARRISAQAERLAAELEHQEELLDLALASLSTGAWELDRRALQRLAAANQGALVQRWLQRRWGRGLESRRLQALLPRLAPGRPPGRLDLGGGWQLRWQCTALELLSPAHLEDGHG